MLPVLLLHGALGAKSQLKPLEVALRSAGYRTLTLNFSGHGGEPYAEAFGIETFADDIRRFLDKERVSSVHCFGYSMGGYVALYLALQEPDRFGKIVTLGTKFDWSVSSALRETGKLDPEKILAKVPAFARILETRHGDWITLIRRTAAMMTQLGEKPILSEQELSAIQNRVLVMLGDRDDMADRSFSEHVAATLPRGVFMLLQDTPHPLEKSDPARLAQWIVQFLGSEEPHTHLST